MDVLKRIFVDFHRIVLKNASGELWDLNFEKWFFREQFYWKFESVSVRKAL